MQSQLASWNVLQLNWHESISSAKHATRRSRALGSVLTRKADWLRPSSFDDPRVPLNEKDHVTIVMWFEVSSVAELVDFSPYTWVSDILVRNFLDQASIKILRGLSPFFLQVPSETRYCLKILRDLIFNSCYGAYDVYTWMKDERKCKRRSSDWIKPMG